MLGLVKGVEPYIKPKPKVEVPRADNFVFRLHYRATFAFLAVASILVSSYSYIDSKGSAIQCMINKGQPDVVGPIVQKYCWIMSTFTLPRYYEGVQGQDVMYHGVGPIEEGDETVYHAYYQWVPLMLMFQAICFYMPHWIWKQLDNGKMKNIVVGLNKHLENEEDKTKKIEQLAKYLKERRKYQREHKSWARNFFFCECLNFINVVIQILLTDRFLGYEFSTYGMEVLRFSSMDQENRIDPMSRVFPRVTKCTFHKYGGSGTIQNLDALCILGMNILSEKIYVFFWFWLIILAIVTGLNIVHRAFQLCFPTVRNRMLQLENYGYVDREIVKDQSKKKTAYAHIRRSDIEDVVQKLSYSDWLILFYLAQSMEKGNFGDLLARLAADIKDEHPYASDEEAAAMRPLNKSEFDDDDDDMVKKPLEYPTDDPDKELSDSRRATLRSPAKFGSFFRNGGKKALL